MQHFGSRPWAALPVENKPEKLLIEQYVLRFLVTSRDLAKKEITIGTERPILFANPRYDQQQQEKQNSIQAIFKRSDANR